MDTLTNMKAMVAVAEAGSFSEAARRIGIATSVVKKRIDQLELQVGTALFLRSTRRMTLTDSGRQHLPRIQRAIDQVDEVLAGVGSKPTRLEGHLRVKVPTTLMALYLGDMLNTFQQRHRNVSMDVVVIDRPVNPAHEGFDVALGMLPTTYSGVTEVGLSAVRRIVTASPAYLKRRGRPKSPNDLYEHDILNYEATGVFWTFQGPTGPMSVKLDPKLSCNFGQHLLQAAIAGTGIACLSEYVTLPSIKTGALVPLLEDFPVPEFWIRMLIPEERLHLARVQALTSFLKSKFVPLPPWQS